MADKFELITLLTPLQEEEEVLEDLMIEKKMEMDIEEEEEDLVAAEEEEEEVEAVEEETEIETVSAVKEVVVVAVADLAEIEIGKIDTDPAAVEEAEDLEMIEVVKEEVHHMKEPLHQDPQDMVGTVAEENSALVVVTNHLGRSYCFSV